MIADQSDHGCQAFDVDATPPSRASLSRTRSASRASGGGAASTKSTSTTVLNYFDPQDPIGHVRGGNLPHWRQEGVVYFVTWRTADSMPEERVKQWFLERQAWVAKHPQPLSVLERAEYARLFPARWEQWLDECHGTCPLAEPQIREIVEAALRHGNGEQYRLHEFACIPNHAHVLVSPSGAHILSSIVQAWKSVTAHAINKALIRKGEFWQKESFDHIVRNASEMERIRAYVRKQCVDATPPSRAPASGEGAASTKEAQ